MTAIDQPEPNIKETSVTIPDNELFTAMCADPAARTKENLQRYQDYLLAISDCYDIVSGMGYLMSELDKIGMADDFLDLYLIRYKSIRMPIRTSLMWFTYLHLTFERSPDRAEKIQALLRTSGAPEVFVKNMGSYKYGERGYNYDNGSVTPAIYYSCQFIADMLLQINTPESLRAILEDYPKKVRFEERNDHDAATSVVIDTDYVVRKQRVAEALFQIGTKNALWSILFYCLDRREEAITLLLQNKKFKLSIAELFRIAERTKSVDSAQAAWGRLINKPEIQVLFDHARLHCLDYAGWLHVLIKLSAPLRDELAERLLADWEQEMAVETNTAEPIRELQQLFGRVRDFINYRAFRHDGNKRFWFYEFDKDCSMQGVLESIMRYCSPELQSRASQLYERHGFASNHE